MHQFLKCLAIGIAVASGCVGLIWAIETAYEKLVEKFGPVKTVEIFCYAAIFAMIVVIVTGLCYLAPATQH